MLAIGAFDRHRRPDEREVEGLTQAELLVDARPPTGSGQGDGSHDLAELEGHWDQSIVLVHVRNGDHALASGSGDRSTGPKGNEGRDGVGGGDRPTAVAARGHTADRAVLLHAEADGAAPLVRLVVIVAAHVEADVAA